MTPAERRAAVVRSRYWIRVQRPIWGVQTFAGRTFWYTNRRYWERDRRALKRGHHWHRAGRTT